MNCFYFAEAPRIQPFHFPQNIQLGDQITVLCAVMRTQKDTSYQWYKDNYSLKKSGNVNFESSEMFSTLIINPVEENSVGNYTCIAKNAFGQDSISAFLYVKGMSYSSLFNYFCVSTL